MTAIMRPMQDDVIRNNFIILGFGGKEILTSTLLWTLETMPPVFFIHMRIRVSFFWSIKQNPYQSPSDQMILT